MPTALKIANKIIADTTYIVMAVLPVSRSLFKNHNCDVKEAVL